jgi:hypothetical protein
MQNAVRYAPQSSKMPLNSVGFRWLSSNNVCLRIAMNEARETIVGARTSTQNG